jgi:hypothetical protein
MPSEDFRRSQLSGQLTPEQWQASALRCPCGFAADDVEEFDGHLAATADMEPEHFETGDAWTLQRVRLWQASTAPTGRVGPVRGAKVDMPAHWFEGENRPHRVGIVLPISAELMVAALYSDRERLSRADLATDDEVWGNAMLVVTMDGLNAVQESADALLLEEHRRTLADPLWLALCRRRVSEVIITAAKDC